MYRQRIVRILFSPRGFVRVEEAFNSFAALICQESLVFHKAIKYFFDSLAKTFSGWNFLAEEFLRGVEYAVFRFLHQSPPICARKVMPFSGEDQFDVPEFSIQFFLISFDAVFQLNDCFGSKNIIFGIRG